MFDDQEVDMERRTRNWATVIYPESMDENWRDKLKALVVPALVSPLHDRDVNADGSLKKPHYHVIVLFDGVKTMEQAQEVFAKISGVGTEPIRSIRAYARYLTHMDDPEKTQYDVFDVQAFGGVDYQSLISSPINKYSVIAEIIAYCEQEDIISYATLLLYSKTYRVDWFKVLCDSGTTIVHFLKSRFWERNLKHKSGDN